MYVSMRVTPDEREFIIQYAAAHGVSVSRVIHDAVFEKFEKEIGVKDDKTRPQRKEG
jgi:uncharacterized protein (DUF1778 family)